jgi:hypothetical protein
MQLGEEKGTARGMYYHARRAIFTLALQEGGKKGSIRFVLLPPRLLAADDSIIH